LVSTGYTVLQNIYKEITMQINRNKKWLINNNKTSLYKVYRDEITRILYDIPLSKLDI